MPQDKAIFVPMALQATYSKRTFHFGFQARTSRGSMRLKDSWFLKVWDDLHPDVFGIGEAGPLAGLSPERPFDVESQMEKLVGLIAGRQMEFLGTLDKVQNLASELKLSSSVTFALETAMLDLVNGGRRVIFDNEFIRGQAIPINGLVWMGGLDYMLQQVSIKIDEGFTCVKIKIGGINFERELDILQFIRRKYYRDVITIRLDADGSFKEDEVDYKLVDLSRYDIHSIEQPLPVGSPFTAELCRNSPIPIALDEELIGIQEHTQKIALLKRLKPQFIILKPMLHGGITGVREWIAAAEKEGVGWWITSALESNVGLNALAQFTSEYPVKMPQGLGTGLIYNDNIPSPLEVSKGQLRFNSQENWDFSELD